MWPFSSSSSGSSASSSSGPATATNPDGSPAALNREQRAACWSARDTYFDCLTKHGMVQPGIPASAQAPAEPEGGFCVGEKLKYEGACSKSWVDYFNQRRVLEFRQRATLEAAQKQGVRSTTLQKQA